METDRARSERFNEGFDPEAATSTGRASRDAELEAELADMRDRWMRSEAEIANVRSRARRDVDDAKRYAVQKFAVDVVEAAENLRRGLDSIPPVSASDPNIAARLREGFLGVERAFVDLLKRNGIVKVDPTGMSFDPTRDQAMSEAQREGAEPGTVSAAWTLNGGLSEADIDTMVRDAEKNAGADKTRRAFVETKNHADATIDRLEKVLVEHAGILNAQDKAAAVAAIANAREAMGGTGEDKLKQAVEHLAQASTRIEEAAAALKARGGGSSGAGRDEAVDAEFEEVGHR